MTHVAEATKRCNRQSANIFRKMVIDDSPEIYELTCSRNKESKAVAIAVILYRALVSDRW